MKKSNFKILAPLVMTFLLKGSGLMAQFPTPIKMLYAPKVNSFAVSGVGGGNLYELRGSSPSSSGQLAIDYNIIIGENEQRSRVSALAILFKYNPFMRATSFSGDSIDNRKFGFVDNEFQFMGGARMIVNKRIMSDESAKRTHSFFLDFATAEHNLRGDTMGNTGFRNFNVNAGYQFALLKNTDFGLVGFTLNPQANFVVIYDDHIGDRSFELLTGSNVNLGRVFGGGGFKLGFPVNDLHFFFEGRKYWSLDNSAPIRNFSERLIFSVGGVATGTIFKNKTKEERG